MTRKTSKIKKLTQKQLEEKVDAINAHVLASGRKDPAAGLEQAHEALELSEDNKYAVGIVKARYNLATCYTWSSNYPEAVKYGLESLRSSSDDGNTEYYAKSLLILGPIYYNISDFDVSLDYYLKCRKLYKKIDNPEGLADSLNGIGNLYQATGKEGESINFYNKALKIAEDLNDDMLIARVVDGLGGSYIALDNFEDGVKCFKRARKLAHKSGDRRIEGFALKGLGDAYLSVNNFKEAKKFYYDSLDLRKQIDDKSGIVKSMIGLSRLFLKNNESDMAVVNLTNAMEIAKEIGSKESECRCHLLLSESYEELGNTQQFKYHYKEYFFIKEKVYGEEILYKSKARELQFEIEKREREKELERTNQNIAELSYNIKQLSDVGKSLTTILSVQGILNELETQMDGLFDCSCFGVGIVDKGVTKLEYKNFHFQGTIFKKMVDKLDDSKLLSVWCYQNQKEVFIPDLLGEFLKNNFKMSKLINPKKLKSLIYMPIVYQDQKIGVISIQSEKSNNFNVYDLDVLRNLAVYVGIAVSNARMYQDLEKTVAVRTKEVVKQKEAVEKTFENTQILGEIGNDITSVLSVEAIIEKVYGNVSKLMKMDAFGIGIYNETTNALDFNGFHELGEALPFHSEHLDDDKLSTWCFKNKKQVVINNFKTDINKYLKRETGPVIGERMESIIVIPLYTKDHAVGVLTVQSKQLNAYSEYEISVLNNLGVFVVIALDNARAYETIGAAKQDLEKLSIVARETENGVLIADATGEIEWCNHAFENMTGCGLAEFKEKFGNNIKTLSDDPERVKAIEQAVKDRKTYVYEGQSTHTDGTQRWLQITLNSIHDDDGNLLRIITVSSDITERKKADDRIKKFADRLNVVNSIDRAILTSESGSDVIYNSLKQLKASLGLYGVSIALFDFRNNTFQAFVVSESFSSNIEDGKQYPIENFGSLDILRKGKYNLVDDITELDEMSPSDIQNMKDGIESYMCYPLIAKGDLIGSINIHASRPNTIGQSFIDIIKEVSNSLAVAIYQNKLQDIIRENYRDLNDKTQKLQQSYKNISILSEIGQKITAELDLNKIAELLYESINELMDASVFSLLSVNERMQRLDYNFYIQNGKRQNKEPMLLDNIDSISVWCIKNQSDVVMNHFINEIKEFPVSGNLVKKSNPQSVIFIPLVVKERAIGVLTVQSFKRNAYSTYDVEMLKSLSSYVAIASENAAIYSEIQFTNKLMEQKNQDILDSIQYAKKIQDTIIPSQAELDDILGENFMIYKPRDIVSGDWYWATKLSEDKVLFTVGDCTGHGVPGAFMSLISNRLIKEIVLANNVHEPDEILNQLRGQIIKSLKQEGKDGETADGLDMALCIVDRKQNTISFAGANCPLYHLRDGEITITKGDKQPIGFLKKNKHLPFTGHTFDYKDGDIIYLFSDGYADQFGGPDERKFKYSQLNQVIMDNWKKPLTKQGEMLDKAFIDWKGDFYQIDDVCLIGVKL